MRQLAPMVGAASTVSACITITAVQAWLNLPICQGVEQLFNKHPIGKCKDTPPSHAAEATCIVCSSVSLSLHQQQDRKRSPPSGERKKKRLFVVLWTENSPRASSDGIIRRADASEEVFLSLLDDGFPHTQTDTGPQHGIHVNSPHGQMDGVPVWCQTNHLHEEAEERVSPCWSSAGRLN